MNSHEISDVFGRDACLRQERITFDEWIRLNERWETMYDMNRKAAMNQGEKGGRA